jgi:CDP-4-dehydro-6-deoxyglucose reductase
MPLRVRAEPSGREFTAEPHEPLLEAALRAGLNIPYRCHSGTCGECRARLLHGTLGSESVHDFPLSAAERLRGVFLLCRARAADDLVIAVREVRDATQIPEQQILCHVARLERSGAYALLHLRTPRTQTLHFLAGQSVDLTIGAERRWLPVASCPCNGLVLQFHLRWDASPFACALDRLKRGDEVRLRGPYGSFLLDEDSSGPLLLVAEGEGFAPIKSLLEHALALEPPRVVTLVWLAEEGGHYLANYCRALADALDNFHWLPLAGPAAGARQALEGCSATSGADVYAAVAPELGSSLQALAADSGARLFLYPGTV